VKYKLLSRKKESNHTVGASGRGEWEWGVVRERELVWLANSMNQHEHTHFTCRTHTTAKKYQ